jgi:hypothetical protein
VKLAWITDPHLDHIEEQERRFAYYGRIRDTGAASILCSGDVGTARTAFLLLAEMSARSELPVLFVYGNHDYYGADIEYVQEETPRDDRVRWLAASGPVHLTELTCVVGQGGWADGYCGDPHGSQVLLADWQYIQDFKAVQAAWDVDARLKVARKWASSEARILEADLMTAAPRYRNILIVTHVPPYEDATWHQGKRSDPDWLPWFACQTIGNVITRVAVSFPHVQFTVLCGHTHGKGVFRPGLIPNLVVKTGAARYGHPGIAEVLEVP